MKKLIYIFLVSITLGCNTKEVELVKTPNILFILADDLGYSDLSCMGSKYYETPFIDKIADLGTVFTDGYAGCQVCSPSRATIMTGQFTFRHGITDWIGAPTGAEWQIKKKRNSKVIPPEYNLNALKTYGLLRKEMLNKNWEPNKNWWGSIPTVD